MRHGQEQWHGIVLSALSHLPHHLEVAVQPVVPQRGVVVEVEVQSLQRLPRHGVRDDRIADLGVHGRLPPHELGIHRIELPDHVLPVVVALVLAPVAQLLHRLRQQQLVGNLLVVVSQQRAMAQLHRRRLQAQGK